MPAIGFAIGEDRLLEVAPLTAPRRPFVVVLPQSPEDVPEASRIASEVRSALPGGCVEVDLGAHGIKRGMARASSLFDQAASRGIDRDSMLVVFVGERERSADSVTVKRLSTGEQETVPVTELVRRLAAGRNI